MTKYDLNFDFMLLLPEFGLLLTVLLLFAAIICGANSTGTISKLVLNSLPLLVLGSVALAAVGLVAEGAMFWGSYQVDALSQFFKLIIIMGFLVLILNARRQSTLDEGQRLDCFLFLTFATLGLVMMASAAELVTIYLAMELASYSL